MSLPVDVAVDGGVLEASTAQLLDSGPGRVRLRATQREDVVVLRTDRAVRADGTVIRDGARVTVTVPAAPGATVEVRLTS